MRRDLEELKHVPNQDNSAGSKQEYPESEINDWDWDELEASPFKGTTNSTQPPINLAPLRANDGATRGPEYEEDPSHGADTLQKYEPTNPGLHTRDDCLNLPKILPRNVASHGWNTDHCVHWR